MKREKRLLSFILTLILLVVTCFSGGGSKCKNVSAASGNLLKNGSFEKSLWEDSSWSLKWNVGHQVSYCRGPVPEISWVVSMIVYEGWL